MRKRAREAGISRRGFLARAGAAAAVLGASPASGAPLKVRDTWEQDVDVVVVGSGAAGLSAALIAHERGSRVLVLEKGDHAGGTTAKSGGTYWVPNNALMRARGLHDSREGAVAYMARLAFPHLFVATAAHLGLPPIEHELLEAFYDNAAAAIDRLGSMGALDSSLAMEDGELPLDYVSHVPEEKAPRGRALRPRRADGQNGNGADLIAQLKAAADRRGIPIQLESRVTRLLLNGASEVVGLEATARGRLAQIRARKAVIFASGGFTHNRDLRSEFLRGPIFGGCAVPTNEGDLVRIATAAGAALANMNNAWWSEIVLEEALASPSVSSDVFQIPGESTIVVNRYGRRIVNEAINYNDRTQVHFVWDPTTSEYPNLLTFMIYDERTAAAHRGTYPLGSRKGSQTYAISGATLTRLAEAIQERLKAHAPRIGNVTLDPSFAAQLARTVRRFNAFAASGNDEDFHRGATAYELSHRGHAVGTARPNAALAPLAAAGPYHAVILAAGTLDTKGGPRINARAQILADTGRPIPGLYGAGNCIAFGGQAYWGLGATLGPALTFGSIAGEWASKEPVKHVSEDAVAPLASVPS